MIPGGLNLGLMGGRRLLAYDPFDGVDGVNVAGRVLPTSQTWISRYNPQGSITMLNGIAYARNSVLAQQSLIVDCGAPDVKITGKIYIGNTINSLTGPCIRGNNINFVPGVSGSYCWCRIHPQTSVQIRNFINGVGTTLTTNTSIQHIYGTNTDFELLISGLNITFTTSLGTTVATLPDNANKNNTYHGIWIGNDNATVYSGIDNFKVESL